MLCFLCTNCYINWTNKLFKESALFLFKPISYLYFVLLQSRLSTPLLWQILNWFKGTERKFRNMVHQDFYGGKLFPWFQNFAPNKICKMSTGLLKIYWRFSNDYGQYDLCYDQKYVCTILHMLVGVLASYMIYMEFSKAWKYNKYNKIFIF